MPEWQFNQEINLKYYKGIINLNPYLNLSLSPSPSPIPCPSLSPCPCLYLIKTHQEGYSTFFISSIIPFIWLLVLLRMIMVFLSSMKRVMLVLYPCHQPL